MYSDAQRGRCARQGSAWETRALELNARTGSTATLLVNAWRCALT